MSSAINFCEQFVPDQTRQNVGSDLYPNVCHPDGILLLHFCPVIQISVDELTKLRICLETQRIMCELIDASNHM